MCAVATAHARKSLPCELAVCYDQESGQTLDIYYPKSAKTGMTFCCHQTECSRVYFCCTGPLNIVPDVNQTLIE